LHSLFVPFTQLYIHPSSFSSPLLHWHTRSSGSNSLSSSSPCSFSFLSSIPSLSLHFHPFCSQTLPLSFPLSVSVSSSGTFLSLCNLALLCPLLAPISIFFLHSLYLLLFLPSPDLCPVHQYALYHALKHHHSPPEITSPLSLFYSPRTFHYLVCLPHYVACPWLFR
jgi:hypothetical protein